MDPLLFGMKGEVVADPTNVLQLVTLDPWPRHSEAGTKPKATNGGV